MEASAAKLLDFQQPFDVPLLQQIVSAAYDAHHPQQIEANRILMGIKDNQEMWSRADAILEQSSDPSTKFFALQILTDAIQTRWKILEVRQREGIKTYIVRKVIEISQDEAALAQEKVFLGKLNQVLVAILKQEWPHNWPNFIVDIVEASRRSEVLCENNMRILKLLSEEVFDFSKDQMTTQKIKTMKESLNDQFTQVYQLADFALNQSNRVSLLNGTLETLQRFLTWIPLGFIFETNLIPMLLTKFFPTPAFRIAALECLTEIASLSDLGPQYDPLFRNLFVGLLTQLGRIIPPETDLASVYDKATEVEQVLIKKLALFFTGFLKPHLAALESAPECHRSLIGGLEYLVRISEVPEDEVFKICLEYYHLFSQDLYQNETKFVGQGQLGLALGGAIGPLGGGHIAMAADRKYAYRDILTRIRHVLITRMAKPEEVLVVEDDNGEVVRETTRDTEAIAQYKTMRETLVYLTHLNYEDTEAIMLEKLALQVDGRDFSWNSLNTLCWAIGSISGAMSEEEEKRFLVTVIKDLLNLCENKRGKDNKAIIASNIMYVVGQYPRFLRAHWKFLRTVVNKLFEFMHELHPGVQDMACDTFLKIAQKCKRKFVTAQQSEQQPFIEELLTQLPTIVSDLETHQVHTFYEAVGCVLSDRGNAVTIDRAAMLQKLMALPNIAWKEIFRRPQLGDQDSIMRPETVREVTKILRTNVRVCGSVGPLYVSQLQLFFNDMLMVYKFYSEKISEAVALQGETATRLAGIRAMRGAKKEVLKLLTAFIEKSGEPESPKPQVALTFVPPMLDPILGDYQRNIAGARDPEVLSLFAKTIETLNIHVAQYVPRIMEAVFECTLQMITTNFEDFPEHRIKFFEFLKAVNTHCFQALFQIPAEHQKLVVDSVVWALKHTERNIAETGLEILHELLQNVGQTPLPGVAQGFYRAYLASLIRDVLGVMTDRLHKSGFKMHATLLRHMFQLVATNQVTVELYDPATAPAGMNNKAYLMEYVGGLLVTAFPNLTKTSVVGFVHGLFDVDTDLATFKQHLRDFLVTLKEFQVEDNADLYYEETMARKRAEEQSFMQARLAVPGLVNPHERPEEGDMNDADL